MSHLAILCPGQQIRLRGKNTTENEHVKLGAYHTLEIELQRPFSLYKQEWDLLDLERIQQACDPAASADLAAVLITVRLLLHYGYNWRVIIASDILVPTLIQLPNVNASADEGLASVNVRKSWLASWRHNVGHYQMCREGISRLYVLQKPWPMVHHSWLAHLPSCCTF